MLSSTHWIEPTKRKAFVPNYFRDISHSLKEKIKYLGMYKGEMRKWPHARSLKSIKDLALFRGSSVGLKAAEAFQLIREIKREK